MTLRDLVADAAASDARCCSSACPSARLRVPGASVRAPRGRLSARAIAVSCCARPSARRASAAASSDAAHCSAAGALPLPSPGPARPSCGGGSSSVSCSRALLTLPPLLARAAARSTAARRWPARRQRPLVRASLRVPCGQQPRVAAAPQLNSASRRRGARRRLRILSCDGAATLRARPLLRQLMLQVIARLDRVRQAGLELRARPGELLGGGRRLRAHAACRPARAPLRAPRLAVRARPDCSTASSAAASLPLGACAARLSLEHEPLGVPDATLPPPPVVLPGLPGWRAPIDRRLQAGLALAEVLCRGVEAPFGVACRRERVAKLSLQALSAVDHLQIQLSALRERPDAAATRSSLKNSARKESAALTT